MAPLNFKNEDDDMGTDEDGVASQFSDDFIEQDLHMQFKCPDGLRKRSNSKKSNAETKGTDKNFECKKIDKDEIRQNDKDNAENDDQESCDRCKKQKDPKFDHFHVYHKKESDSITRNASFRQALFNSCPRWLKSLLQEPEYVMAKGIKKHAEEVHQQADSLFSTSSGFTNYRGLLNLCIILLVLSNARLFLENIIKYGILIDPVQWVRLFLNQPYSMTNLSLLTGTGLFVFFFYGLEKMMLKNWLSETVLTAVQSVTLVIMLLIPAGVVLYFHPNPAMSTVILGIYTVMFLKLISYASVNKWCRQSQSPRRLRIKRSKSMSVADGNSMASNGKEDTMLIQYPDNITLSNLFYFMFAPTLCYELNFPRSLRIRKRFLLKRIIEMLFLSQLIAGCIQQWMLPLVHNSMKPLADMDVMRVMERLLKLAIPNHFIWLMFFYWFFHSTLNVIAELLKFGDREFYKDWWNSDTVNQFWTYWNVPVHRWCLRHVYKPLVKRGYSKLNASVAVFFISAFFHEYLLSVPLQMFRLWAFMGMLGQVPLAIVQTKYIHGKYGNMIVWLSLILGQPIAVLAYFHDYYVTQVADFIPANQTMSI